MIGSKDVLEVGAGLALGYGAAKLIDNANRRADAEAKMVEEAILYPETYNGRPMGALAAEVLREMQEDAYIKKHGPPKKTYTADDVKKVFDPPATPYPFKLGKLTPELEAKVEAIKSAPDLQAALHQIREIPELFKLSRSGEATIFELRLNRTDPDAIPNNWHRTYATSINLVASKGVLRNNLRLQSVQHDAIRTNNVLERGADQMGFDHAIRTDFLTGLISSGPVSAEMLAREMKGKLSPEVLGDAVKQLLVTGLPTRVDQKYYGL